jgi:hypothetical protein
MWDFQHMPNLRALCAAGTGCIAVCPSAKLLAVGGTVYSSSALFVWQWSGQRLTRTWTLNRFRFSVLSGHVAFLPGQSTLLMTDDTGSSVHVLDAATHRHRGYLAPRGTIDRPLGLAVHGSWVAVVDGEESVKLFRECGHYEWGFCKKVKNVFGHLRSLRFARDGSSIYTARCDFATKGWRPYDRVACVVSLVDDDPMAPSVVLPSVLDACKDVEQVHDGWLLLTSAKIEHTGHQHGGVALTAVMRLPVATAMIDGFGLVVRDMNEGLFVFSTFDLLAMTDNMSALRFAWIRTVVRVQAMSVVHRR